MTSNSLQDSSSKLLFSTHLLWQLKLFRQVLPHVSYHVISKRMDKFCGITWNFNYGHFRKTRKILLIDTSCLNCIMHSYFKQLYRIYSWWNTKCYFFSWSWKMNGFIEKKHWKFWSTIPSWSSSQDKTKKKKNRQMRTWWELWKPRKLCLLFYWIFSFCCL